MQDVVLVGGGHAHVEVIRRFGMHRLAGVRLTLITPEVLTPYSGMVPGYVSGFYTHEDCHIDLIRLARFADARLVLARAKGIDTAAREVELEGDRPNIAYDVLSLNVGITPSMEPVDGAKANCIPVKPITTFSARFEKILHEAISNDSPMRVAVVGGGAGGVELACALRYRLIKERSEAGIDEPLSIVLVSKGPILKGLASYARRAFAKLLKDRNIEVIESEGGVAAAASKRLTLSDGSSVAFDVCLWCTHAEAPRWLSYSGLRVDEQGFVLVNENLQVEGGPPEIFAVGDAATSVVHPRPKAGVYAVRAGPPLYENIRRFVLGQPLQRHVPQSTHLNLISAGDRYAIAVKGWFGAQGGMLWHLKDRIDRQFMQKYGDELNFDMASRNMQSQHDLSLPVGQNDEFSSLLNAAQMRCAGCASKIGARPLAKALRRLEDYDIPLSVVDAEADGSDTNVISSQESNYRTSTDIPNGKPEKHFSSTHRLGCDDAAVLPPPPKGHVTVHTVDFFKAIVSDPYVSGVIAATHALSDCYAMAASPLAALAIAVLPFASQRIIERDLFQMLAGAKFALAAAGCELVGGHSTEGSDVSLGFSIYGSASPEKLLHKGPLLPGQCLVLTKPLGTGILLAAEMRGLAKGVWIESAIAAMQMSNAEAAKVILGAGATACTDVTGFGLIGHLAEMIEATRCSEDAVEVLCEIFAHDIPLLPGTRHCLDMGVRSSLHPDNSDVAVQACGKEGTTFDIWPLLVDPQTSGGLLAAVPYENACTCISNLQKKGFVDASIIGQVLNAEASTEVKMDGSLPVIRLISNDK